MTQWRLFWNVGQKPKNSTQRKSLLSILLRRTSPPYCKDNKEPHQTFFDLQLWSWGFCTVVQLYEKCQSKIPNVQDRWIGHDQCYWRWYQDTNDTLVIDSSNICTHLTQILQSSVSSMHYLGKKFGQTMYVQHFSLYFFSLKEQYLSWFEVQFCYHNFLGQKCVCCVSKLVSIIQYFKPNWDILAVKFLTMVCWFV